MHILVRRDIDAYYHQRLEGMDIGNWKCLKLIMNAIEWWEGSRSSVEGTPTGWGNPASGWLWEQGNLGRGEGVREGGREGGREGWEGEEGA